MDTITSYLSPSQTHFNLKVNNTTHLSSANDWVIGNPKLIETLLPCSTIKMGMG